MPKSNATIRYVSKTGLSIPPYTTWETAADSIQECINICVFGDTIYVANGVYEEQVVMIPGLALIGAGMDSCEIFLSATGIPAVEIKDTCLFRGFKILLPNTLNTWGIKAEHNGYDSEVVLNRIVNASLGISVRYSNPFVYKNIFENAKSIGVRLFNSNSIIRKNIISPITEINGSGIFITSINSNYYPLVDSNHIEVKMGNVIYKSIGSSPLIKNNVIEFIQYGAEGIYLSTAASSEVYNNLILIGTGQIGIDNYNVYSLKAMNNYIIGKETKSPKGMYVSSWDTVKNNVVMNTVRGIVAGNP